LEAATQAVLFQREVEKFVTSQTLTDFEWARTVVITRVFGFQINNKNIQGLVPLADMLNHNAAPTTKWQYDTDMQAFTVVSTQWVLKGIELLDSYGPKCNSRYLVNYGFALPDNQANNEAAFFFDKPPQTDKTKNELIGHLLVSDNGMTGYEYLVVNGLESKVSSGVFVRFQMSSDVTYKWSLIGFSYLRLLGLNSIPPHLLNQFKDAKIPPGESALNHVHVPFINVSNEMFVLNAIATESSFKISEFYSTLQELQAELKILGDTYCNRRNIVITQIGELQIFHFYMDLFNTVTDMHIKHNGSGSKIGRFLKRSDRFSTYGKQWLKGWNNS
jgi:hypothetical protein